MLRWPVEAHTGKVFGECGYFWHIMWIGGGGNVDGDGGDADSKKQCLLSRYDELFSFPSHTIRSAIHYCQNAFFAPSLPLFAPLSNDI